MIQQTVLPAISTMIQLKRFLATPLEYGILMNFQLAQLPELVSLMKGHRKKVLIHAELIKGLSSDEFGAIFLIQNLKVDGIISSKPKAIEVCQKRKVIGIFRFFIRDTISFEQSLMIAKQLLPDYIEILPASSWEVVSHIKSQVPSHILMGGLITSKDQVETCLQAGAISVTTSQSELWEIIGLPTKEDFKYV